MADYEKSYIRKGNALKRIEKMKLSKLFECIMLRKEIVYDDCGVEISTPILKIGG